MFSYKDYPFDTKHSAFEVGGEAMIFHCNHYLCYLQRSILDADYIDSRPFLIGAAADSVYNQLLNLGKGKQTDEIKKLAEEIYKASGYGLINLDNIGENGGEVRTTSSFYSKSWLMKFGQTKQPVDYFTSGFIAAAFAVAYGLSLGDVVAAQIACMAIGDAENIHTVTKGKSNFTLYHPKKSTQFKEVEVVEIPWEHSTKVTEAFIGAHYMFVGNDDGLIPAFGVYVTRNYSDHVNRLQFEFISEMRKVAGSYGAKLGTELMLEAGHACGFFTYGGIMTSVEWNTAVKPYLKTKEDWIYGLLSLINTMGWGYHTALEVSPERSVFRNYNDFEDMSYLRMHDTQAEEPISWANSGGFTGLCHLIYKTGITDGKPVDTEEGFRQMRRSIQGYKTNLLKGIANGNDYLEVEISL